MNHLSRRLHFFLFFAAVNLIFALAVVPAARAQQPAATASVSTSEKPYLVEWAYKVKWGHADEFWQIFKKYQIAILNREKELGYIKSYTVYRPGLHTGEDTRWEYRIVIAYKNQASSTHGSEVAKLVFPDHEAFKRGEDRRWELTEAHYDLPIRVIDPNGDGEE